MILILKKTLKKTLKHTIKNNTNGTGDCQSCIYLMEECMFEINVLETLWLIKGPPHMNALKLIGVHYSK